ncbi:MAG: hypothetical protein F4229_05085 [Gammaproteobacteria bacterium]|nr:hypothetical protein [Gammaproteobacteria bacterium]
MMVAAFYRFVHLERLEALRSRFEVLAAGLGLKGTILVAEEGINGGLCGAREALDAFMAALCEDQRFAGMPVRHSKAAPGNPVFQRLKVRIKPEIVSLGRPEADPLKATGQRVAPADWNALLDRSDVQVVDVRNAYETALGGFPRALDPDTERFRDFPAFVEAAWSPDAQREGARYCTGGIRCEKASAYLLGLGFERVHQLDGGILGYLASVPAEESRWRGDCFVFDQRVALDGGLREAEVDSPPDRVQSFSSRSMVGQSASSSKG